MEAHAHAICSSGGDVLNVGFGLGLIDEVGRPPCFPSPLPQPYCATPVRKHADNSCHMPLHMCILKKL